MILSCPGFDGSNPLHLFASLGILRLLPKGSTMRWEFNEHWLPIYESSVENPYQYIALKIRRHVPLHPYIEQNNIVNGNPERVYPDNEDLCNIKEAYFFISEYEVAKMHPEEFRALLQRAIEVDNSRMDLEHPVRILSALNAEGKPKKEIVGEDQNKHIEYFLQPTDFSFSNKNGQQYLLKDFLNLVSIISADAVRYSLEDNERRYIYVTSLNWDPTALRSHAYQWTDPSEMPKETDVAANALAFLGLASFPVMPTNIGNVTTGFNRDNSFIWPIWERAITLRVVDSLLATLRYESDSWHHRGVTTLFRSVRTSINKRYYFLKSEEL